MANKKKHKLKTEAYPTHILTSGNPAQEEALLFVWSNGDLEFSDGFIPKRGQAYDLVPNIDFESQFKRK